MKPSLQTSDYQLWLFPGGVKCQDGQATAVGQGGSRMCALASWALVGFHWWLGCCSRCDEPGVDHFQLIAQGSLGCCRETVCLHLIFKHSPDVFFVLLIYMHIYLGLYTHMYINTHAFLIISNSERQWLLLLKLNAIISLLCSQQAWVEPTDSLPRLQSHCVCFFIPGHEKKCENSPYSLEEKKVTHTSRNKQKNNQQTTLQTHKNLSTAGKHSKKLVTK